MSTRSRARQIALQALYQLDQPAPPGMEWVRRFVASRTTTPELTEFAMSLVDGVARHRQELDLMLTEAAENWSLDRMPVVDRNALRLGAFELRLCPDTPPKVAIDEAIELVKRYSTAQSGAFVNGVLDRLLQTSGQTTP